MHLTRGNHETKHMNMMYGFDGEVTAKFDKSVLEKFRTCFNWLPLACCINHQVLVLHGGLFSKDGVTLDDIKKLKRGIEPPEEGLMTELL